MVGVFMTEQATFLIIGILFMILEKLETNRFRSAIYEALAISGIILSFLYGGGIL